MRALVLLLALGTALAGCLAPAQPNAETLTVPPDAAAALGPQMAVHGCREHAGFVPIPMGAVDLPEGFTEVPFDAAGATGTLFVSGYACDHLSGTRADGAAFAEAGSEMFGMLMVEPPEAYRAEGVALYAVLLGVFTTSEDVAKVYEAWGATVYQGEVVVEDLPGAGPVRTGHALGSDGAFTVHLYTTGEGDPGPSEAGKARAFVVEEGKVKGVIEYAWTAFEDVSGHAVLRLSGDTPFPESVSGGFSFHGWGEEYGWTITLLPMPAEPNESPARAPAPPAGTAVDLLRARLPGL